MTGTTDRDREATCPRCGYDLRGTIATWREQCPLEGRCTECGYEFEWRDIFDPRRQEPAWSVEFAPRRAFGRACGTTFLRSLPPWHFWKRLQLRHTVHPARLALYACLVVLIPLLVDYVYMQVSIAIKHRAAQERSLQTVVQRNQAHHQMLRSNLTRVNRIIEQHEQSEEASQDVPDLEVLLQRRAELEAQIAQLELIIQSPNRVEHSYHAAVFEMVFMPLAEHSRGSVVSRGQFIPYTPPRNLFRANNLTPLLPVAGILLFLLLFPVTYICLPITRRRAKVRSRHFLRITAYSMCVPALMLMLVVIGRVMYDFLPAFDWRLAERFIMWLFIFGGVLALAWWYFAIRLHLRLPNALLQVVLLSIVTILLPPVAFTMGAYGLARLGILS